MWWLVVLMFFDNTSGKAVTPNSTEDIMDLPSSQWLGSCSEEPSVKSCLKMKSVMLLEDLTQKDAPIYIFGKSMTLVKNLDVRMGGRMLPVSLEELNSSLPKDEVSREETLDSLLFMSLEKFVKSRALQIRLPDLFFWNSWNSIAEGRRKGSFSGAGWAMALAGGMMAALGLGSIAMMSGKAMMVSMMALMLSALAAFRKGGGGGDQAATTYEVINVPTGHGHHHARSMGRPRSLLVGVTLPGEVADQAYVYRGWNTSEAPVAPGNVGAHQENVGAHQVNVGAHQVNVGAHQEKHLHSGARQKVE